MPGPPWSTDDPRDTARIGSHADALVRQFAADAPSRQQPTTAMVLDWHARVYDGCRVPSPQYLGALRGDPSRPDLADYEVGVGPVQADGWPEKVGVFAANVTSEVDTLITDLCGVLVQLDAVLPVGHRPATVDELDAVVGLVAGVHGEWVRIHPFANGNGRTARLWAAWLALRYDLPVFVAVKPRPHDVAYARAGQASMGRPPLFVGDHSIAHNVFANLLALAVLP